MSSEDTPKKRFEMQNEWWIWLLIIVAIIMVFFFMKERQSKEEAVSLTEVFAPATVTNADVAAPKPQPPVETVPVAPVAPTPAIIPVAQPTTPTASDVPPSGAYAIQLYAFRDKGRAEAKVEQLKTKGLPAYLVTRQTSVDDVLYRILVGEFASKTEAQGTLQKLKMNHPDAFVVQK